MTFIVPRKNLYIYQMKKTLLIALLLFSLGTFAQEKRKKGNSLPPEKKVELQVARMKIELDLNEQQTNEIQKILADRQQKRAKIRAEFEDRKDSLQKPSSEQREQMKKNRDQEVKAFEEQLHKILSASQYETWQKRKEERENKRKERKEKRAVREN